MGEVTDIAWAKSTQNNWRICAPISPGCVNCYAEVLAKRTGIGWGRGVPRLRTTQHNRNNPYRWNKKALASGETWRVFFQSLSDWADAEVPREWVDESFTTFEATQALTIMMLTKRHERIKELLPSDFERRFPHVWLGVSVEDQKRADLRLPAMRELRALYPNTILWVSYEPALGYVDWTGWEGVADWIIFGGESGPRSRDCDLDWFERGLSWCRAHGVKPFMKQSGTVIAKQRGWTGKGDDPAEWPQWMQVREFPQGRGGYGTNQGDRLGVEVHGDSSSHHLL